MVTGYEVREVGRGANKGDLVNQNKNWNFYLSKMGSHRRALSWNVMWSG